MHNDSETITANEINKFTYCPYQFYYERVYGRKEITRIRKIMLEESGYTDTSKSNLKRGLDYHKDYNVRAQKSYPIFRLIIIVILIVIGFYLYDDLFMLFTNFFNYFNVF